MRLFTMDRGRKFGRWNRICLITAALGSLALGGVAQAQLGIAGGFAEAFEPDYVRRDVRTLVEELDLDDTQRVIIESLFLDYQSEFDGGLQRMREKMNALKDGMNQLDPKEVMHRIFQPVHEWRNEKLLMKDQLLFDMKAFLTEEQMEMWPGFERKFLRSKSLSGNKSKLAGEGIDLILLFRNQQQLNNAMFELVRPQIDAYELAMHSALLQRDQIIRDSHNDLVAFLQNDDGDLGVRILKRQLRERKTVRNLNEEHARAIAAALPEEYADLFYQAFLDKAHPRVFRPTSVQRMFKAAMELPDLDPATLQAVIEIEGAYLVELDSFNNHLVETIKVHQPKKMIQQAEQQAARMAGQNRSATRLEDPIREEFKLRDEMADPYVSRLQTLLTPEQFASLPGASRWLNRRLRNEQQNLDKNQLNRRLNRQELGVGSRTNNRRDASGYGKGNPGNRAIGRLANGAANPRGYTNQHNQQANPQTLASNQADAVNGGDSSGTDTQSTSRQGAAHQSSQTADHNESGNSGSSKSDD